LTFNNWQNHPEREARMHNFVFDDNVRYVAFSYEVGEQGTPHLQGVAVLWGDRTKDWMIQQFPAGIHWEIMRGTFTQASEYCGKNGNTIFHFGKEPQKGRSSDILGFKRLLDAGERLQTVAQMEPHHGSFLKYQKAYSIYAGWQQARVQLENDAFTQKGDEEACGAQTQEKWRCCCCCSCLERGRQARDLPPQIPLYRSPESKGR
jgi:hypothetical protein